MGLFDGKTEAATPKRRDEARKKGQFAKSRELISVAVLVAGFYALAASGPRLYQLCQEQMVYYLSQAPLLADRSDAVLQAPVQVARGTLLVLLPLLCAVSVAALVANVLQTGPLLITDPLKVDFKKLNPLAGLKRLVSPQSLVELLKSTAKVGIVGWVVFGWLRRSYPALLSMVDMELPSAAAFALLKLSELCWKCLSPLMLIAVADFAWQRYQHETSLMMTRQEVRDEIKSMEGSPEIKGAIRRRQRQMARGRMLSDVPQADVVVTNPTHYAVALKYDPETMVAPQVLALGQRLVALKIREVATAHHVPIVENPPLARALFAACRVGDEVPPELYAAVAEVLAYIYRLAGKAPGQGRL